MKIQVVLIGQFIPRLGFSEKAVEVPAPFTAGDLAAQLGLGEIDKVMAKNGQGIAGGEPLKEGDRVVIAPIFSGG
jgi:sulfur carrier protein ThiS